MTSLPKPSLIEMEYSIKWMKAHPDLYVKSVAGMYMNHPPRNYSYSLDVSRKGLMIFRIIPKNND